jgi:hypothetical protein
MRGRGLRENILLLAVVGTAAAAIGYCRAASADTLEWALVQAYQNNPSLNAQRAALRAVDENVPQALSGYRPKLSVTASGGYNYFRELNKSVPTNKRFQTLLSTTASASRSVPGNSARPRRKRFSTDFKPPIARGKRKANRGRARDVARHRAASSSRRRYCQHEFAARSGDP